MTKEKLIYYCDCCGREIKSLDRVSHVQVPGISDEEGCHPLTITTHICNVCLMLLVKEAIKNDTFEEFPNGKYKSDRFQP